MESETINDKQTTTNPLVSIIVITYNSSKYVIETLESAKAQTYRNIELIVSDDCSTDITVDVCMKWIEENKSRFVRTELITASANTGIPANCNRGVKAANGEWVKLIAGDDIMSKYCIELFLKHTSNEKSKNKIYVCNKITFEDTIGNITKIPISKILNNSSQKKQLFNYAIKRPTIAPFAFYRKEVILLLGGYDEGNKLLEDSPFYFKALKRKIQFELVNQDLIYYRITNTSISNATGLKDSFKSELINFERKSIIPFLLSNFFYFNCLLIYLKNTEKKSFNKYFLRILNVLAQVELKFRNSV